MDKLALIEMACVAIAAWASYALGYRRGFAEAIRRVTSAGIVAQAEMWRTEHANDRTR